MAHVHCGSDQGTCFRIAGEICPTGYEMKPVLSGHDGNFLVSCRAPRSVAQAAPSCTPSAAPATTVSSLMSPYPWPPPQTAAAQRTTLPASSSPSAEIDLGY